MSDAGSKVETSPPPQEGAEADRDRWSSRAAFYFAAVGSAVGFGNVWRFPSLVFEFGGGAFFIPYLLALFLVGIPILVLEVSLGQHYQTGDVNVFGSIHERLRGVGLSSVACGYMLVTYYSILLAWVTNAFFDSFGDNFWAQEQVTGTEAKDYFYNEIIGMGTLDGGMHATRMVWPNVGYSFLTWILIYLCTAFGLKWTGRITYFTMGFPIILLFVFLGRAVTLEGAQTGIDEYIRNPNLSMLKEKPDVWAKAVSQIFFSIGITFGIMTAYGSYCKKGEPAFMNSCVVASCNSLFSFIAGFAVFATMGHLAFLEDVDSVSKLEYSGFGLVFGSWPVALGTLPGGEHWIRLFFFMLFLLGIDSAFSFMEASLTVLADTKLFQHVERKKASFVLTMVAFLLSLMYATDAGLNWLDTIDFYINYVMLLVGGFECYAAGWVYNIEGQFERLGQNTVIAYHVTTFGSVTLASILWFGISDADTALWAGFVGWVISYIAGMFFVTFLLKKKMQADPSLTLKGMYYDLTMRNAMELKSDLSESAGYLPTFWIVLVKHFIPPLIIILFALDTSSGKFGAYGGYPVTPYQVLGIMTVVFAAFLFISSMVYPKMYSALEKPKNEEAPEEEEAPKKVDEEDVVVEAVGVEEPAIENEDGGEEIAA
jgi:SNF family Na+-dependent transporter